jgi:hypothetical protein
MKPDIRTHLSTYFVVRLVGIGFATVISAAIRLDGVTVLLDMSKKLPQSTSIK